jgi:DNA-binding CsgD family transcriptional regulator
MLEVGSIATSGLSGTGLPALPSAVGKTAGDSAGAALYDGSSRTASPGSAGAVSTAPVQLWRQSAGHPIEQLHQGFAAILARSDAALAVLDGLPFGIIVINGDGVALLVSRRAEQILAQRDGLVTHGGKLAASRPADTARLRRMIARTWRLADGPGPHASDGFQLARPSGRNSLVIRIVPLKPKIAALAVLVCDPETRTQVDQSLLHQVYRLTRTEARLVIALAQGERLEGAAQTLGVTLGTGRTYLKRVFHKMGVSRQVDLMRLVLCGPTQFSSD